MYNTAILAYDGFATFELGCGVELFALPRPEFERWYRGEVVSFTAGPLRCTGGMSVNARIISDLDEFDMLVVPSWPIDACLSDHQRQALFRFIDKGGRALSFCSGAFLLAELGILNEREATTHWRYAEAFKVRFPKVRYVEDVLYVYDGRVGCSAGSAAAIDLGMEVIRRDFGYVVANKVARRLVMSPHRSGGQSQFVETPLTRRPDLFAQALDWAVAHLADNPTVDSLAQRAHMSRRSFDRHFRSTLNMSPKEWLSREKLKRAQHLLEVSREPIELIACKTGFANALTLRHNFHKFLSISPSQYRQQFGEKQ